MDNGMKRHQGCLFLLIAGCVVFLQSCGIREGLAPVEESIWRDTNRFKSTHVVARGETLYAIAFRYEQDYHRLATVNHLTSPYTLHAGQVITLKSNMHHPKASPSTRASKSSSTLTTSGWRWPVHGTVVTSFVPHKGQKGIDISGRKGQKIRAASSGVVAYAGNGLPGYGNLIILKHDKQYLTAYGYNQRNLVREGQSVTSGQVIADMGVVNRRFWGVHFEIRRLGEPVNPLVYLKKKA
jgi:lipoprotein NlpD